MQVGTGARGGGRRCVYHLAMVTGPALGGVLGEKIKFGAGEKLPAGALLPEQLQLRDAGGLLRAAPHEEEVAEGEDPRPAAAAALEAERPVEDVGAVRAARGADPLRGTTTRQRHQRRLRAAPRSAAQEEGGRAEGGKEGRAGGRWGGEGARSGAEAPRRRGGAARGGAVPAVRCAPSRLRRD